MALHHKVRISGTIHIIFSKRKTLLRNIFYGLTHVAKLKHKTLKLFTEFWFALQADSNNQTGRGAGNGVFEW